MTSPGPVLSLRFLGGFSIERGSTRLPVPTSRKARALLAYLVDTDRSQRRERLCELFFDRTDDPRAALRWNLAKLRPLVNDPGIERLVADRAAAAFARIRVTVDTDELQAIARADRLAAASTEALEAAAALCGEFLQGSELDLAPEFGAWLAAVREDCRVQQRFLLETLLQRCQGEPARQLPAARRLVQLGSTARQHSIRCRTGRMAISRPAARYAV